MNWFAVLATIISIGSLIYVVNDSKILSQNPKKITKKKSSKKSSKSSK
ncbi:MAG: hypothetical protein ACD_19C00426G0080 [uncultured bacterium]|nr:MAG: hypothetical protein ACD_19C00426G0080 [uncultured bacterium]